MGFSIGPIAWRDMILYADRKGMDPDVAEAFVVIVRSMDAEFLDWQFKEQERKTAGQGIDQSSKGKDR